VPSLGSEAWARWGDEVCPRTPSLTSVLDPGWLRVGYMMVLPAVLDIFDIATANDALGQSRARIAKEADRLYERARGGGDPPTEEECRKLQDEIYTSRRVMGVPGWFYRLTRDRRQRSMEEVVREQVDRLPAVLRPS
jgi:SMODS-associating 4TM effector domain